jgi:signal transduction histidine kinase
MGMRERTELLEGALEVESGLGRGTIIRATFPTRRRSSERGA